MEAPPMPQWDENNLLQALAPTPAMWRRVSIPVELFLAGQAVHVRFLRDVRRQTFLHEDTSPVPIVLTQEAKLPGDLSPCPQQEILNALSLTCPNLVQVDLSTRQVSFILLDFFYAKKTLMCVLLALNTYTIWELRHFYVSSLHALVALGDISPTTARSLATDPLSHWKALFVKSNNLGRYINFHQQVCKTIYRPRREPALHKWLTTDSRDFFLNCRAGTIPPNYRTLTEGEARLVHRSVPALQLSVLTNICVCGSCVEAKQNRFFVAPLDSIQLLYRDLAANVQADIRAQSAPDPEVNSTLSADNRLTARSL